MTASNPTALWLTRGLLRWLTVFNWFAGACVLTLLAISFLAPEWAMVALGMKAGRNHAVLWAARLLMIFGIGSVPLMHVVLTRLRAIVETVNNGDPFVAVNAVRLRHIAWALLGIQLFSLVIHAAAAGMSALGATIDLDDMTLTSWMAVLLAFVLARVFEEGARMRDEIEELV